MASRYYNSKPNAQPSGTVNTILNDELMKLLDSKFCPLKNPKIDCHNGRDQDIQRLLGKLEDYKHTPVPKTTHQRIFLFIRNSKVWVR